MTKIHLRKIHLLKVERLEGLTDGIFAFAMTIMVLNLGVPKYLSSDAIWQNIKDDIYTNLPIYIGSFTILGTHWVAMNFQLGLIKKLNRPYLWANIIYLMIVCVIPFSANLLGTYPLNPYSMKVYAVNLLCGSLGQLLTLECAHYYDLYKEHFSQAIHHAALHRLLIGPLFYISSMIIAHWNIVIAYILLIAPTIIYLFPSNIDKYEEV